ncbi:MAG: undecaprenyl-diphosphate phosphatase [Candidatus Paceibacterota bacterium]|jgi:undecaprenyl-diphosphatase
MNIIEALILGLVEGFTEFLPISSTAHLILTSHILGLAQSDFVKTFEIAIQSGAILAVLVFYWKKFFDVETLKRIVTAFIPTAVIGLILYKFIKQYLFENITVILWALALGGLALIIMEIFLRRGDSKGLSEDSDVAPELPTYKQALFIGLIQSIAVIPGVSRSAATIMGGLLLGLSRSVIVEFSFLLAVPTIAAATLLDLTKNYQYFSMSDAGTLLIGFVSAFITAWFGIKFLLAYVRTNSFIGFGVYRIVLVLLFIFLIL